MSVQKQSRLDRFANHFVTKLRKRLKLGHALSELTPELVDKEIYFEAPPFTPELLATIRLISPQFHLRSNEASRLFWQLNQNGLCWGEFLALEPYLRSLGTPTKVLDIGSGLGRSVVFLKKAMGWKDVPFHLYESTGDSTRYTKAGPRFDDSFCGNLEVLKSVLDYNQVRAYEVFDAVAQNASLRTLPGPYDWIHSFFAVGFHWSIEHFLDEILDLMHEGSLGAFTLHDRFDDFSVLRDVPHRVVDFRKSWPRGRWARLLVLAKDEAALVRAESARG